MSIFGNSNTGGGGGSLFGNNNSNQNTGGGGLFGNNNNNQSGGGTGLFGSNPGQTNNSTGGGGLFGNNNNQNTNTGTTGGLFGASATQNKPATGGLFGSNPNATQTGGTGLFGSNPAPNTQNNTGGGIFGSTNNAAKPVTSLFGSTAPQQSGGSLFGGGSSLLGGQNQTQQPQQQQQQQLGSSILQPPTVTVGNFGHTLAASQYQKLQFSGLSTVPNEKKVAEQIATVAKKWNPNNAPYTEVTTVFKTYLYNAVPKEYAPFYYPNAELGEDEASWEEALSHKPDPPKVDGQESTLAYVPILCKGFKGLGDRVETQAKVIEDMRFRLHEMNNSLKAVMDAHQQRITVKIQSTKRHHQVLSQRCLRLAVKVQVLRNRGYALDSAEEILRRKLLELEKQVMDPGFVGREDEIWARMVALRERARWLEEEGKRLSSEADEQSRQGANASGSGVPEDVLVKTRKILKDYDGQLQHLNRELADVKKEFAEWEQSQQRRR